MELPVSGITLSSVLHSILFRSAVQPDFLSLRSKTQSKCAGVNAHLKLLSNVHSKVMMMTVSQAPLEKLDSPLEQVQLVKIMQMVMEMITTWLPPMVE